ncbi:MAG: GNVR domain-containing protein [Candidatus Acidiferrum sp.]
MTFVGCGLLGLILSLTLPKKYISQTVVLVSAPTVPEDMVKPMVTEPLSHRLASMKEQILSRSRLRTVIEKLGLYADERSSTRIEDLEERLRSSVDVKNLEPMPGTDRSLPGFSVLVTFNNPRVAQQICTQITSMFQEQFARDQQIQGNETNTFLSEQLAEAKAKLDETDAKLAQFKKQYLGSLPEEEQTNLSLLMGTNSQLEANTQALSRAQQDKAFNESLLSQQEANWKAAKTGNNPDTQEAQLAMLQDQLTILEGRYTAEHPDVIKVKNSIAELQKRMAAAPPKAPAENASTAPRSEPPQLQQLRAKVRQDDQSIKDLLKRQDQIQQQTRVLQGRVQASPMVEQQLTEMTRNYKSALEFYNNLLKSRDNAAMATELQHQQAGEQFKVLDPPSLPDEPSFPRKLYFIGGGLLGGLALGFGLLGFIAMNDKSMYTEKDAELCLKLPVLASVPTFTGSSGVHEARRQNSLVN